MTTSGWGAGEWNDMAWGSGVDYPYNPIVFLDAEGPLAALTHIGSLARLAKTGTLAALQHVGILVEPVQARPAGQLRNYTARGTLLTYTKTGTLE